jgi:hypothetical protein
MIGFMHPNWLWLLGLIPLIHWLHRFKQRSVIFPTTTLFLWSSRRRHPDSDGLPGRPDRRWLLRSLIAALLILSLAQPVLQTEHMRSIEVWLDDSLSMYTVEGGQQRMQHAMDQLLRYLVDANPTHIQVHSLGNSAALLSLESHQASQWQRQLAKWTSSSRGEPENPPSILPPRREHILITDGADAALNNWAGSVPLHQVIRVGAADQNIALTRLSLREPVHESQRISGIVRVDNTGDNPQQARLIVQLDEQILANRLIVIPASDQTNVPFTLPQQAEESRLLARLESADDPLSLDNSLELHTGNLSPGLHYHTRGNCGKFLQAVLDAYPVFIEDETQPQLFIDCTVQGAHSPLPTLRLPPPLYIRHSQEPAHWHANAPFDSLQLAFNLPYNEEAPPLSGTSIPILSADDRQLIRWAQGNTPVIESYLDNSNVAFARQAEYPLLIIGLIEQLTGKHLTMASLNSTRDVKASRIKPQTLAASTQSPDEAISGNKPLTLSLIILCLLLLLLDAALVFGLHPSGGRNSG